MEELSSRVLRVTLVPGIGKLVTAELWFFCSCSTIVNQTLHDNRVLHAP